MQRFYLVDVSIYIFRAWFSMDENIVDGPGNPVNAVYGFTYFLAQLLERVQPEYKANREPAPLNILYDQLA